MFKTLRAYKVWSAQNANKPTGYRCRRKSGDPCTIQVCINGKLFHAHRVIWEMMVGPIPRDMEIDHINGDPWNNRMENLRLVTHAQNCINKRIQSNNRCGIKGVYKHSMANVWTAELRINGQRKYLGCFKTKEDADAAYKSAAKVYHGEFMRQ